MSGRQMELATDMHPSTSSATPLERFATLIHVRRIDGAAVPQLPIGELHQTIFDDVHRRQRVATLSAVRRCSPHPLTIRDELPRLLDRPAPRQEGLAL